MGRDAELVSFKARSRVEERLRIESALTFGVLFIHSNRKFVANKQRDEAKKTKERREKTKLQIPFGYVTQKIGRQIDNKTIKLGYGRWSVDGRSSICRRLGLGQLSAFGNKFPENDENKERNGQFVLEKAKVNAMFASQ